MRYSQAIQEHFENPRNVGPLPGATHQATVTNPICGDLLTLQLQLRDGQICAASFQADGCVPTYAVGSQLTERCLGRDRPWAESLTSQEILEDWLGGVPPGKEHVAILAIDALRQALGIA